MKRLLVTFDDDAYEDLRRLAFEKKVPMAQLVRFALDKTFEDDLDVIAGMRGLEEHLKDPSNSISIEEFMESQGFELPRRSARKAKKAASRVPTTRKAKGIRNDRKVG